MKLGHEGDIYYSQKFVVDEGRGPQPSPEDMPPSSGSTWPVT